MKRFTDIKSAKHAIACVNQLLIIYYGKQTKRFITTYRYVSFGFCILNNSLDLKEDLNGTCVEKLELNLNIW